MLHTFFDTSHLCSKITTELYSTSFSSSIRMLHPDLHQPIYDIYGFVRFADEIVDTFHDYDKQTLLQEFIKDTDLAIKRGISLNPILNSFQFTVNKYHIDLALVAAFFKSMEMDLLKKEYSANEYQEYIYGSAEVVGLMCLYVFCDGNKTEYENLKQYAQSLGAAFQKINFLRDIKADNIDLSRTYFPNIDFNNSDYKAKSDIENDIEADFKNAYKGIKILPKKSRFGVYVAYKYYTTLFDNIKKTKPSLLVQKRIRVSNAHKAYLLAKAKVKYGLNIL